MKPRVKKVMEMAMRGEMVPVWVCFSGQIVGYGYTALEAYSNWEELRWLYPGKAL